MEKSVESLTLKRKRDATPAEMLEELEELDRAELSDDSKDLVDELQAKAKAAFDDPELDQDSLKASWTVFDRLYKKVLKGKREVVRLKEEKNQLSEKLSEAEQDLGEAASQLNRFGFLFKIGDWCEAIHDAIKYYEERDAKTNHSSNNNVIKRAEDACKFHHLTVDKFPPNKAQGYATNSRQWSAARGKWCTSVVANVEPELKDVGKWKESGEDPSQAPFTPYLDRLDLLCQDAGLSRTSYLATARVYSERNEAAHNPCIKLVDHVDPATKIVDWHEVKKACESIKEGSKKELDEGRFTAENHSFFVDTVNHWLRMHVSSWPAGSAPVLTTFGEFERDKAERAASKRLNPAAHNPHHGPSYKKGKYDDL
ncbi:uncharacterized protein E0L32_004015 [Thyridium curvatum]|uniref:Uncharacterized protein n=1 Tax=Thyridium curvatum TaxID=1093900 RepID=A0A507BAW6_9PEZI|nr:uncharacterized protein E0L32_004015 [Thyridium curvatum]TPX16366.1 hypothetical protein E0L32_004015 [Thyridium curvatum]